MATATGRRSRIILLIALVFGLVNAIVKPIVAFLSIPLYILTLGLFTIIVNALMLMLTAWITEATDWGLRIDNFGVACWAAIIVSIVSLVLSVLIPGPAWSARRPPRSPTRRHPGWRCVGTCTHAPGRASPGTGG